MASDLEKISILFGIFVAMATLLGLPAIVPYVKGLWIKREIRKILDQVSLDLPQACNAPSELSRLQDKCDLAIGKSQHEHFTGLEEEIKYQIREITEARIDYIKNHLHETTDPSRLFALQEICEQASDISLKNQFGYLEDNAKEHLELLKSKLRYRIRLFFIECPNLNVDILSSLFLKQNEIQPIFQLELGHFSNYNPDIAEKEFNLIKTDNKINFVKECECILQLTEKIKGDLNTVRIVITEKGIPGNYYIWGHFSGKKSWKGPYEPDKFWILSPTALTNILDPGVLPIQPTLLRMVQRVAVISVVGQLNHDETYGCLFDTTNWLRDGQYFVRNAFICEECRSRILRAECVPEGHRVAFLNEVQKWIVDSMQTPKLLAALSEPPGEFGRGSSDTTIGDNRDNNKGN